MLAKSVAFSAILTIVSAGRFMYKDARSFIERKHRLNEYRHATYTIPLALDPHWGYQAREPKTVVALCAHSTAGSDKAKEIKNIESLDTEYEGLFKGK